jgi:hypothetical protein
MSALSVARSVDLTFLPSSASVKYADFLAKAGKADVAMTGVRGASIDEQHSTGCARSLTAVSIPSGQRPTRPPTSRWRGSASSARRLRFSSGIGRPTRSSSTFGSQSTRRPTRTRSPTSVSGSKRVSRTCSSKKTLGRRATPCRRPSRSGRRVSSRRSTMSARPRAGSEEAAGNTYIPLPE